MVFVANFKDFLYEFKRSLPNLETYFHGRNKFMIDRAKDIKIHYHLMAKEKIDLPINEYDHQKAKTRN